MKLLKKELEQIPLEPYPKCEKLKKGILLVMTATQQAYRGEPLLIATFYNTSTKQPYCRIFHTQDRYTTKLYETGKWSSTKIDGIKLPGERWNTIEDFYSTAIADSASEQAGLAFFGDTESKNTIKAICARQNQIKSAKLEQRNENDKSITERVMALLPELPQDMEQQLLDGPMRDSRYLFYRRGHTQNQISGTKETTYFGYCTYCKKEYELDFIPKHRTEGTCPQCGSWVRVRARGISRQYEYAGCNYMVWGIAGEAVFARMFVVTRSYNAEPENIKTELKEVERFYFERGRAYKFTHEWDWYGKEKGWKRIQQVTENYYDYYIYPHPKNIFTGTCAEHSHMDDYIEKCQERNVTSQPMLYLTEYVKHPAIEHLLGCGMYNLVDGKIGHAAVVNQIIDWNKSKPKDLLGVNAVELEQIIKLKLSCMEIRAYQQTRKDGITLAGDDLEFIKIMARSSSQVQNKTIKKLGIKSVLHYLKTQKRKHYGKKTEIDHILKQWMDYRCMAEKLHYDLATEYNGYPPNLKKAHDKVADIQRENMKLENELKYAAEKKEWDAQYKALEGLCYSDGELCIRPAASRAEMIEEGEKLEHCVAGYAERVKQGETHIFFIRRVSDPKTPYFTMNIEPNGDFIQCHGYKNEEKEPNQKRPQFIKDFEEKWMKEIVEPWIKQREKEKRKQKETERTKRTNRKGNQIPA